MRLLYITTEDPKSQGDYLEVSMLHGLREILGSACVDFPRKKIMYGDFSDSPKNELHGRGFVYMNKPIEDIDNSLRDISVITSDKFIVLYGCTESYGMVHDREFEKHPNCMGTWYLDGDDKMTVRYNRLPCFKRELKYEEEQVYATGFGYPEHLITPIDFSFANKTQLYQKTAPFYSLFGPNILGQDMIRHYIYTDEQEYLKDIQSSYFGLVCARGGFGSLRMLEVIGNGALLMYRDYHTKPEICDPHKLPCFSYSTREELVALFNRLLVDGKPTQEYVDMLCKQRAWLWENATTKARALQIIKVLENVSNSM